MYTILTWRKNHFSPYTFWDQSQFGPYILVAVNLVPIIF